MVIDISKINEIHVITLVLRFDAANAPAIEDELKNFTQQNPKKVLFDFSQTVYIASVGLRVLLSSTRSILQKGGTVALSSLTPKVRQVFEIAGFTKIFSIFDSKEEALRYLQK